MTPGTIAVVAEHVGGELSDITLEMLTCTREIARAPGWHTTLFVLTDDPAPFQALPLAAAKMVIVTDPALRTFNPSAYARVLSRLLKDLSPQLILLGNTGVGTDLAGPLERGLGGTVVSGCTSVRPQGAGLEFTSRLFGGKLLARMKVEGRAAIALILPGIFRREPGMVEKVPATEVRGSPEPLDALPVRFLELVEPTLEDVDVRKVSVLVAAGRGIQSKENIAALEDLAKALGGAVCATRPVVDQGWLPRTRQVGRSGMVVKPRLYLALGVSGAPEHVEGMKDAELIVAVNTDAAAPIFDIAHYGATVDALDLVPLLTEKLRMAKEAE